MTTYIGVTDARTGEHRSLATNRVLKVEPCEQGGSVFVLRGSQRVEATEPFDEAERRFHIAQSKPIPHPLFR
jgi:hypothetical protein